MVRKIVALSLLAVFAVSISGCATCGLKKKTAAEQMEDLKSQVSTLESQLQSKDEEIASCRDALAREMQAKEELFARKARSIGEVKSRPNTKQIQTALQNAGYNPGAIDGKMGNQTREAIKAFQAANGLEADGKVGSKTWSLLKDYLYKKSK